MKRDGAGWHLVAGVVIAATTALSACASAPHKVQAAGPPAGAYRPPPPPELSPAQMRGLAFAARRCGGCHNVGLDDGPPYEGPAFRTVAARYDSTALQQRFAQVAAHGVDRMPPVGFTRAEADDLVAYFKSLRSER